VKLQVSSLGGVLPSSVSWWPLSRVMSALLTISPGGVAELRSLGLPISR
jgi:hypothetical protein